VFFEKKLKKLSWRERQLFLYLFQDLRMKEIAAIMKLDTRTIDTYASSIYRKFEVNGRIGLILSVLEETKGLIPIDSSK
jgi:DNA-binding NarL/FixJ family response regulator